MDGWMDGWMDVSSFMFIYSFNFIYIDLLFYLCMYLFILKSMKTKKNKKNTSTIYVQPTSGFQVAVSLNFFTLDSNSRCSCTLAT